MLLILVAVIFLDKQPLAERQKHDDADDNAYQSDRSEREKRQRSIAILRKNALNNKVGRRTDKRQHTAKAAGKG